MLRDIIPSNVTVTFWLDIREWDIHFRFKKGRCISVAQLGPVQLSILYAW